jgi:aryl-alcohol dehydrogenase-like predicted oxidoreductase
MILTIFFGIASKRSQKMKRILGKSGIESSAVGMGCWAIGGPWTFKGQAAGWGQIDDKESIRAVHLALDMGVSLFDTAANYGCGHSERVLSKAINDRRDRVVIATKFGYNVDENAKEVRPYDDDEENGDIAGHLRSDCEASLRRLNTDYIDIYQLHVWGYDISKSREVRELLEALVSEGKIRAYGWSTDRVGAVRDFAQGLNCTAVQQQLNVFEGGQELLRLCGELNLASLNRGPLGMGILTGKFTLESTFADDDVRSRASEWFPGLRGQGVNPEWLEKLEAIREILTSSGRTLAQGALAWIWAASPMTVPIPGFKTAKQVQENAAAMQYGPLLSDQMHEIDSILGRQPTAFA